jgi:nucleotide-binding universal stress UspA family protein
MINRILIPLEPSATSRSAVENACLLARQHDAEVTGMTIVDDPGIEDSLSLVQPFDSDYVSHKVEEHRRHAAATLAELLDNFKQYCANAGVAHREWQLSGHPEERIHQVSAFFDLIVVGLRSHFHFETTQLHGQILPQLLNHCTTPILALPEQGTLPSPMNVLIAYNGSLPSIRTVRAYAMNWAHENTSVRILMANGEIEGANQNLSEAVAFLRSHGAAEVETVWTPKKVLDSLDGEFYDWADLIVLGAHSRRPIADFFTGSLSKTLIQRGEKPLFISL